MLKHLLAVIVIVVASSNSFALVDLKNANYAEAWIDMSLVGNGYDLKIQRTYNSRTYFNGMFGFGWCSDFETALDITPEGNIKLTECGAGLQTVYTAKSFSEKDIDKTVKQIMAKVRADNASVTSSSYFNELEKRLRVETPLRGEYAAKYSITRPVADNTKFYAFGIGPDYIEKQGNNYVRINPEGSTQKFKLNGKLEKIFDRNGNYLAFNYDGKTLKDVTDNNGRKITFQYYENGKVKSAVGPDKLRAEYKFKNLNDLVFAKNSKGETYTYEYNDVHNLVKTNFPDKTYRQMGYDNKEDWITSYRDVEGCEEKYNYEKSRESRDHFWVGFSRKCKDKQVAKGRYEFWYDVKSDNTGKYLRKSKTQENDVTTDVTYNEQGRPLVVARNGKNTKYEYHSSTGLLYKKTSPEGITTTMQYDNPFKKVSKVERSGKTSEFAYDSKGNLTKATNSDGQRINLAYDNRGRIIAIEDQAKRKVSIEYEERFGKPSIIKLDSVGKISVNYTPKGEIAKVASPAGASVAVQVASTFNNLLDLIQPAGVSLSF